ncbi:hypothetical protein CBS147332_6508 [Penicillium roqueforti]|nr:hypothetical protein CBS147332_6508 [Penicillium roqueforti]KAI3111114.1 hypothetical protein CBS147331_5090 [Penicillium roqueforti]
MATTNATSYYIQLTNLERLELNGDNSTQDLRAKHHKFATYFSLTYHLFHLSPKSHPPSIFSHPTSRRLNKWTVNYPAFFSRISFAVTRVSCPQGFNSILNILW